MLIIIVFKNIDSIIYYINNKLIYFLKIKKYNCPLIGESHVVKVY